MIDYLNYWFSINAVTKILDIFAKNNIDIRFVGGCVRDALLGGKNPDIDFAINCKPEVTSEILNQNDIAIFDYGIKYGSITAVIEKNKFEITSLREDRNQSGRHTDVIFTNDWHKDASRRDFTFNAITLTPEGKIIDYFNGQEDIKLQQVKFIGNIEQRITEDYLRIIRYYRFLGLFKKPKFIKGYQEIVNKNIHNIRHNVSNDRMREELLKMLKNEFKNNSFIDSQQSNKMNNLIESIRNWWIEENYKLGLYKCINKFDHLIKEN